MEEGGNGERVGGRQGRGGSEEEREGGKRRELGLGREGAEREEGTRGQLVRPTNIMTELKWAEVGIEYSKGVRDQDQRGRGPTKQIDRDSNSSHTQRKVKQNATSAGQLDKWMADKPQAAGPWCREEDAPAPTQNQGTGAAPAQEKGQGAAS